MSAAIENLHEAHKGGLEEEDAALATEFRWPVKYHHSDITIHFTLRLARYKDIIFIAPPRDDFRARALHKLSNLFD